MILVTILSPHTLSSMHTEQSIPPTTLLSSQHRPIHELVSSIKQGGHTLSLGSYPLQSDGVGLAHTLALQVVVASHTRPVGEVGTQAVDLHMLALHVLHRRSEVLHLLVSPIHCHKVGLTWWLRLTWHRCSTAVHWRSAASHGETGCTSTWCPSSHWRFTCPDTGCLTARTLI